MAWKLVRGVVTDCRRCPRSAHDARKPAKDIAPTALGALPQSGAKTSPRGFAPGAMSLCICRGTQADTGDRSVRVLRHPLKNSKVQREGVPH